MDPSPRLGRWVGWWLRVVVDYRTNSEAVLRVSCWDTSKRGGDTKGWCRARSVTSLKMTGFYNLETVILHQLCLREKPNSFFFNLFLFCSQIRGHERARRLHCRSWQDVSKWVHAWCLKQCRERWATPLVMLCDVSQPARGWEVAS